MDPPPYPFPPAYQRAEWFSLGKKSTLQKRALEESVFLWSFIILLLYSVVIEEYAIVFEREVEEPTQSFYVRKGRTVETNSTQPVKNRRQIWSVSLTSCSTSTQFCAVVVITTYNRSLLPVHSDRITESRGRLFIKYSNTVLIMRVRGGRILYGNEDTDVRFTVCVPVGLRRNSFLRFVILPWPHTGRLFPCVYETQHLKNVQNSNQHTRSESGYCCN